MKAYLTTCLWFDDEAEEAAKFYTSVFKDSKMGDTTLYPEAAQRDSGKEPGTVMSVEFELNGQRFMALNGGKVPGFEFTPATSFIIPCETQEEIDYYWEKLSTDPEFEQCGWCKDKYGVTWQVTPYQLDEMLKDSDKEKVERVTAVFMDMKKLDLPTIEKAYNGE